MCSGAPSATLGALTRLLLYLYSHDYPDKAIISREKNTRGRPAMILNCSKTNDSGSKEQTARKEELIALDKDQRPHSTSNSSEPEHSDTDYSDPASIPLRNIHVYGLGDFYQIQDLKDAARRKFSAALTDCTDAKELSEIVTQACISGILS